MSATTKLEPGTMVRVLDGSSGRDLFSAPWGLIDGMERAGAHDDDVAAALRSGRVTWLTDQAGLRRFLREYGAWSDAELSDDGATRERAFWVGACNASEEPGTYCYTDGGFEVSR